MRGYVIVYDHLREGTLFLDRSMPAWSADPRHARIFATRQQAERAMRSSDGFLHGRILTARTAGAERGAA